MHLKNGDITVIEVSIKSRSTLITVIFYTSQLPENSLVDKPDILNSSYSLISKSSMLRE